MMNCKLTKAQQAIEDRIMANLTPLQRFKMEPQTAALIYAIQKGDLPLPNLEKLAIWEARRRSGALSSNRCESAASGSVASSQPGSPIADVDLTPKASENNVIPGSLWNDALMKIDEPAVKPAKKTAKTRKKKNLEKPETEIPNRELSADSAVKPKMTAATTVVKKALSSVETPSEKQTVVMKTSESVVTSAAKTVSKIKNAPSIETPLKKCEKVGEVVLQVPEPIIATEPASQTEEVILEEGASPPKIIRKSLRRSQSSPPPATKEPQCEETKGPEQVVQIPEENQPETQPRKSKRSLTVDLSKKINKEVDVEIASPQVRRSRLGDMVTTTDQNVVVEPQNEKKRSLRLSKNAVEKVPEPIVDANPDPEDEEPESEEEIDEVSTSSSGEDTETEGTSDDKKTPIGAEDSAPTEKPSNQPLERSNSVEVPVDPEKPPENKSTRTRPVNKATRTEAQTAGPEADQQQQEVKQDGPTRTRVKNKANRVESRNAGPDEQQSDFLIPSASALVEAEKMMQNFGKSDNKPLVPKTNVNAKPGKTYGNAPNSAQKPRLGTPLKATAIKKPPQMPATSTKIFRVEGVTPQQKGPITQATGQFGPSQPVPTTIPVPFGSGGAPSKPKLQPVKNPSRPNSPITGSTLNKMPIAMGLAGAVALGKIAAPVNNSEAVSAHHDKPKYDNLVTNVMSFMPQTHGLQGAAKLGTQSKLTSSTSASALQKAAAASGVVAMGIKAKVEGKAALPPTSTTATKAPTATKLAPSGTSTSKLPIPTVTVSTAAKPVPAAHVIVQPMQAPPPPKPQAPPPQPQPQQFFNEENMFNSTYSKGLDSTMAAFDITRFDETYTDYPIDDVRPCGDDDDDEEDDLKPIPDWAKPARLNARIEKQNALDSRIRKRLDMDEDKVNTDGIDEALHNPDRPHRMRPRTSSQHWTTPPLLKLKQTAPREMKSPEN